MVGTGNVTVLANPNYPWVAHFPGPLAEPVLAAMPGNDLATDRNGTAHRYTFDVLGRLTTDAVTSLDGTRQRLDTAHDTGGRHPQPRHVLR
jgi:YD repeat-containing protein